LIRLAPGRPEIVDHVEHGRLVLDGNRLVADDSSSIVERRRASFGGYINVTLVVKGRSLAVPPGIALLGIPDASEVQFELQEAAETAAEKVLRKKRWDEADLAETVRRAVRRTCRDLIDKKPVTEVQIAQLPARA
ncbi:MAG: MBL fold metallo-hydrolase, partial [Alphaproteobacteria bacterium]|nr:MBL fold metallo-hydrolase [Alphaproteobacteria bacterium]